LIEFFWNAAQYVLGSASRPGKVVPALWGPWVINDVPSWYGDMTMVRETHLLRAI
jgi:alpha-L-fucosidase 2